jgi:hypothetical protein
MKAKSEVAVNGAGTKSVANSKRSTTGKFEGGTKFGEYFFIKKGAMKDKQNW